LLTDRLPLEFSSWIARMRTPEALSQAIRLYQESASAEVKAYFELQEDGSFTSDTIMAEAQKRDKQKRHRGESVPFYLSIVYQESGVAVLHKQRQLVAWFQIVSIIVPAHHIFDVHAVSFCDTGQRIAFTHAIGDAIAVAGETLCAATCANRQSSDPLSGLSCADYSTAADLSHSRQDVMQCPKAYHLNEPYSCGC
jgi:hypothetical protein